MRKQSIINLCESNWPTSGYGGLHYAPSKYRPTGYGSLPAFPIPRLLFLLQQQQQHQQCQQHQQNRERMVGATQCLATHLPHLPASLPPCLPASLPPSRKPLRMLHNCKDASSKIPKRGKRCFEILGQFYPSLFHLWSLRILGDSRGFSRILEDVRGCLRILEDS